MKTRLLLCALILLWGFSTAVYAAPPSEDYVLAFSDEFEADALNTDVWQYRTGAKYGGVDLAENIYLKDGKLFSDYKIAQINGQKTYTGGGVITKFPLGYGYYETKAKTFGGTGALHTSFWSSGGIAGDNILAPYTNLVIEIDGFEINSHTSDKISIGHINWTAISSGQPMPRLYYTEIDTAKEEFILGYEWLPDRIVYYINNVKVKEDLNPWYFAPQQLWLTAVAMPDNRMHLIDDANLPGYSYWEYFRYYKRELAGTNLLGNSGFENNNPKYVSGARANPQLPLCFFEEGDQDSSRVIYDHNAFEGEGYLKHGNNSGDYRVFTSQKLYHIPNGSYDFAAYIVSSGGQKIAQLVALDSSGNVIKSVPIEGTDNRWVKITLSDIPVTEGYCQVGIQSQGSKEEWLLADELYFSLNEGGGKEYAKKEYYSFLKDNITYLDEITIKNFGDAHFSYSGDWKASSAMPSSLWLDKRAADDHVKWDLSWVPAGDYMLQFFNNKYEKSATVDLALFIGSMKKFYQIDQANDAEGYIDLGIFEFSPQNQAYLKLTPGKTGANRAEKVRLIPKDSYHITNGLILALNKNSFLLNGIRKRLDATDLAISPYLKEGKTLIPLRFISESMGFDVMFEEETATITIQSAERVVSLVLGEDKMTINGEEICLEVPGELHRDKAFLPLRAISEALGKTVTWNEKGIIIIADRETVISTEFAEKLLKTF